MPDAAFADDFLASLYDRCNGGWAADDDFYLDLVLGARDVLDVGCGTGVLLDAARGRGHTGRLVGLDPAPGMLRQARGRRDDVDWVQGYLPDAGYAGEFDLLTTTGHAFQVLQSDDDVLAFLRAAAWALRPGGRLAFETRNPLVRPWRRWTPENGHEISDDGGHTVRVWHDLVEVADELVTFTETFDCAAWPRTPLVSRSTLRFLPAGALDRLLVAGGFTVHERYGGWDRTPWTPGSPEIITVALLCADSR